MPDTKSAAIKAKSREDVLKALEAAQQELGHTPRSLMTELAAATGLSTAEVYGVASFYSFISVKPTGRHVIRICNSLPCHIKDADKVVEAIRKASCAGPCETSGDRRFTLQLVNCIRACDGSPAMLVDDDTHTNLKPESITEILSRYK